MNIIEFCAKAINIRDLHQPYCGTTRTPFSHYGLDEHVLCCKSFSFGVRIKTSDIHQTAAGSVLSTPGAETVLEGSGAAAVCRSDGGVQSRRRQEEQDVVVSDTLISIRRCHSLGVRYYGMSAGITLLALAYGSVPMYKMVRNHILNYRARDLQ